MKTWLSLLILIVGVIAVLLVMCVVLGIGLTWVGVWITDRGSKKNMKKVCRLLPNTDCGQCGCNNCAEYAQTVADFRCEQGQCPYITPNIKKQIEDIFFVPEVSEKRKLMDVILGKK